LIKVADQTREIAMHRRAALVALLLLVPLARPAVAAVESWTRVGPDGGVVQAFAAAPSRPSTVYAGLSFGGVFRSLDGGASWSFAGAGLDAHDTVRSMVVDSRRPDTVWTAAFQGVYRSTDGGTSWALVLTHGAATLAQSPVSGVLYAGIQGGPMLRSTDGGTSWQTIAHSPQNVFSLAIDPFHPQTLYAGGLSGFFKSTNGGAKWVRTTQGLPSDPLTALTVDPRSGTLYLATVSVVPGKVVFRSTDGGARWTSVDGGRLPGYTNVLAADPSNRNTVWAVSGGHVFRSLDRGLTWSPAETGLPTGSVFALLPVASTVLAGTAHGPFRSEGQGISWHRSSQGLQAAFIFGLALDSLRPSRLWAVSTGEVYRTVTGGGQWGLLTGVPPPAYNAGPLAADPNHPGTAFLGLIEGVAHTTDAGTHWSPGPPLSCVLPETIAVDPLDSSLIYVAGLFTEPDCEQQPGACADFRSDDAGQTWTCLPILADVLVPDPFQPSQVYALSGEDLYGSADRGASWSLLVPGVNLTVLAADPHRPGTLWGAGHAGLSRSDDGGRTWRLSDDGIPQFTLLSTLALDPVDPDVLYAGTLLRGVFKSADGGATWTPLGTGLTGINVRFLVIDPRDRDTLYAGTDESGVMKIRQSGE
jgi:photosystem II stability/assembly factor-like uncharacterized protein